MTLSTHQRERLFSLIDASGDCWEWTGRTNHVNRGVFYANGKTHQAHRIVWETLVGPVPDGLELDHLCRHTVCVNPDHLEPVTHRENMLRGFNPSADNAKKTHCKRGHPFDEKNTYVRPNGHRTCRRCLGMLQRRWRQGVVGASGAVS